MDFKGNYRIEAVYFEKLKRDISEVKRLMEAGASEEARALLENAVDVDGAVLLLYRNLGELWADLADKLEETNKALRELAEKTEKYHDELNEKIDEINNYLMALIRALDERLTAVEQDLATMQRVKIYDVIEDSQYTVNYVYYKGERVTKSEINDNLNVHLLIFRYNGQYFYLDNGNVQGPQEIIEARSFAWINNASVGYNMLSITKDPDSDFAIGTFSDNFVSFGSQYELTMTSLTGGTTDRSKSAIAWDYLIGKNVLFHGNLGGIDIYLTVTGVYTSEISPNNYIYNIKAFGYDPTNENIYLVDMPFTGGNYDFNLEVYPVIKTAGDGLAITGSQINIDRIYFKEQYTVVFSALSSSATMTRKETGETLTFNALAAAVASGNYHITAEATENWAGQQGNPITYYFNLETFKNNDGFSNNGVYFKGWKGSSTSHEFEVLDVGITYDTTIYELAP